MLLQRKKYILSQTEIVRNVIQEFCVEFVDHPYRCYTEHGIHALLFARLFKVLKEEAWFTTWQGIEVCTIQKEYPTAHNLEKSKRQHWDLALIKEPVESLPEADRPAYDYFKLAAAIEVGLNEPAEHLEEDIRRLLHEAANVEQGFILHLYRLAKPGRKVSRRDWSYSSPRILSMEKVEKILAEKCESKKEPRKLEVLYAVAGDPGEYQKGAWLIRPGEPSRSL